MAKKAKKSRPKARAKAKGGAARSTSSPPVKETAAPPSYCVVYAPHGRTTCARNLSLVEARELSRALGVGYEVERA